MPKINRLLIGLVGLAIATLVILSVYEIFLKPADQIPDDRIQQINTYYGEDVLQFIQTTPPATT